MKNEVACGYEALLRNIKMKKCASLQVSALSGTTRGVEVLDEHIIKLRHCSRNQNRYRCPYNRVDSGIVILPQKT